MDQPLSCRPAVGDDKSDFSRDNECPDPTFYSRARLVEHLDNRALETVERLLLVQDWIRAAGVFDEPRYFASRGQPRPADDRYAELGIPSDPVIAVYAERAGGNGAARPEPAEAAGDVATPDPALVPERKAAVRHSGCCPYCEQPLSKWAVPQTPFTEWNVETMYVCFNDYCPYYVRGWQTMESQGNFGFSYHLRFNPDNNTFPPLPVPSHKAFRSGILGDASDLVEAVAAG